MTATFYVGDALEVMATLPEKSVDLVLSSPPFLALRSYLPSDHPLKALEGGSQSTPGAYIDWLVDVVEACDRVLAPHGSMCIELGDTYAGSGGGGGDYLEGGWREGQAQFAGSAASMKESNAAHWRQKNSNASAWPLAKSLSLIPELFRLTLVYGINPLTGRQTERWRLRNVIRWVRPNPPVGALGDKFRPATSELMVFCKSAKRFFDLDAVREPYGENTIANNRRAVVEGRYTEDRKGSDDPDILTQKTWRLTHAGAPPLDWWNIPPGGYEGAHYAVWPPELCVKPIKAMSPEKVCRECGEPSRRISEAASSDLLGSVIRKAREAAGMSQKDVAAWFPSATGGVTGCVWNWENGTNVPMAEQWDRLKEGLGIGDEYDHLLPDREAVTYTPQSGPGRGTAHLPPKVNPSGRGFEWHEASRTGTDRFSDCGHNNWRPGLILDPFAGSGTTLAVATGHGRDAIGIDLDERNYELALERVGPLVLTRGEVAA